METGLHLGSKLLQVGSKMRDLTWSNKDPCYKPGSIFESVIEEINEIEAIQNEGEIREAEMIAELDNLKERINEYKIMQLEDAKYKEIVDSLIQKGVISKTGEEIIKFYMFCIIHQFTYFSSNIFSDYKFYLSLN